MIFLSVYIAILTVTPVVGSLVAHYILDAYIAQWVREYLYIAVTMYCLCSLWAIRHSSIFDIEREYNIKLSWERVKEKQKMKHAITTISDMSREFVFLQIEHCRQLALLQHKHDMAIQELEKMKLHGTKDNPKNQWQALSYSKSESCVR
jgi:hypothetical protein